MKKVVNQKYSIAQQCLISIVLVFVVSVACFFSSKYVDYRITALVLLMTVSFVAMLFDILPVLLTAVLSGLILNYFFIEPIFTFHITDTEDVLLFLMYLIIALVNAVLTFKIREAENKARDKEEKVKTIQLYDTLLNSLSHELKTPIATIVGAIDVLKENRNKLSETNQSELLEEIDKASIRLNTQVENLLNMSRLETGMLKLKLDWCDINELIYAVIQKNSPEKLKHNIVFVPNDKLPLFKLDGGLIEEVIQNLVTNAIQYTPEDTIISIDVKLESDCCIISVLDTGNGFPESEIQYAFDKFYRLQSTKTGGSGLGLSIVKGFVEAHNGTVELKSNPNRSGACFVINIPVKTSYINHLKNE